MLYSIQNCMTEWSYTSTIKYEDPFNDVELSAIITDPDGMQKVVPAFWAGDDTWRIRYASPKTGIHHFQTCCSDMSNKELHYREGDIEITAYEGENRLFKHGPLHVSDNGRYFVHDDGTPFFWLGDTWWMGLTSRLQWPYSFQMLTSDRVAKGFTVIQIVAGLYPDMPPFDERGANETGFPWTKDFVQINPCYYDSADIRIGWLVKSGLAPCIVACWGYFLPWMGIKKMKQHWRNLVARYGAYPVVWCLAGEGSMPYYLSAEKEKGKDLQKKGWAEIGAYLHQIDPYKRPVTLHPNSCARDTVSDESVLDFDMLQTGHGDSSSLP
ncbi:MAG: DUF5060 domain-containing protein, partial [Clostridiales bacterium]|nr:DUF5060 domain-containing protein [Clostridiales bacterium]